MRLFLKLILCCAICLVSCKPEPAKENIKPIKIACVGNSITYGSGVANRAKNAYPAQLQNLLGDGNQIKNFGVSGNTLLKKGDYPYWESEKYKEALAFKPDIVYIKLGTNDSKQQNRVHLDSDFETDYKALIQSFKDKNKDVRVVLLLPVPSFYDDSTAIWNPVIKNQIIPKTQKVAFDTNSEVIDLYQLFIDQPNLLPDKIHPSSLGATAIAKRLYENVIQKTNENDATFDFSKVNNIKRKNFYGFLQTDFSYNQIPCKIVEPKHTAEGKPWVLRARFFGHEPQTDIALLERGFHIAYCDVSNLFGNEEAIDRWNKFYQLMMDNGFAKKVVLEGMSRGGLIIYNWAATNPSKVACVYADAPVLDGKSWPGGKGAGSGSPKDWEHFKTVYSITSNDALADFKQNPIHQINDIVEGNFLMLHVCGEEDKVVPVDENSRIFEHNIKDAGGDIKVIYKPEVGHHPHSLNNPTPIVDFILRATSRKLNFATIPAPGSEYRSGAGWKEGKGWWFQASDIDSLCRVTKDLDILLIGNSITQGWGGNRTLTTYKPGQTAADIHFKDLNWVTAGISGDRTEHILWRIENGQYNTNTPKMVVLAIGVNNFPFNNADEIVLGIENVVNLIEKEFPESKILFLGPLPTALKADTKRRRKYDSIHAGIAHLGNKPSVYYVNTIDYFSDENGNLNNDYYGGDGIHLKPEGYNIWGQFIRMKYDELIRE